MSDRSMARNVFPTSLPLEHLEQKALLGTLVGLWVGVMVRLIELLR